MKKFKTKMNLGVEHVYSLMLHRDSSYWSKLGFSLLKFNFRNSKNLHIMLKTKLCFGHYKQFPLYILIIPLLLSFFCTM